MPDGRGQKRPGNRRGIKERWSGNQPQHDIQEVEMIKLEPRYSGRYSEEFWAQVNALPEPQRECIYLLGCILQDLEGRVLKKLEEGRGE